MAGLSHGQYAGATILADHIRRLISLSYTPYRISNNSHKPVLLVQYDHLPVREESGACRFLSPHSMTNTLADPEIERIMREKMRKMMRQPRRIMDVDDHTFQDTINQHRMVLVDFWAEWCGPCKIMHPVFEEASRIHSNVQFARVNVDQCSIIPAKYQVMSIPTLILFLDGRPVERITGATDGRTIHRILDREHA